MDLNRIQTFLEIARAGNLTRAALSLGVQKSKLSRDLALLEQDLGAQLVYRTTRQFKLTDMGQRLFDGASLSLHSLETVIDQTFQSSIDVEGRVSLTCPEDAGNLLIVPLLDEFLREYPKVTVDLYLTSELVDLVAEKVDIALRMGQLKDSNLKMKRVGEVRSGIYCSPQFFETIAHLEDVHQLEACPFIGLTRAGESLSLELRSGDQHRKLNVVPKITTNSFVAIMEFLKRGHGIGILPEFMAESEQHRTQVIRLFKPWTLNTAQMQLVFPYQKELPIRVRTLSDYLYRKLKRNF